MPPLGISLVRLSLSSTVWIWKLILMSHYDLLGASWPQLSRLCQLITCIQSQNRIEKRFQRKQILNAPLDALGNGLYWN